MFRFDPRTSRIPSGHRCIAAFVTAVCVCASLSAQNPTPTRTFETAAIHPLPAGADPSEGHWSLPGSPRFNAHHLSLTRLIQLAYGADRTEVLGVPSWADQQLYDIDAVPEGIVTLTPEELEPRLQALLAERFGLISHREDHLQAGYAIVIGKHGTSMKPGNPSATPNWRHGAYPGHIEIANCTMSFLARQITMIEGVPCIDRTGLAGPWDVKVVYAPSMVKTSTLPPLTTAIQEQAGLRLEATKVNVHALVVDHVNRTPAEN